MDPDGDQGPDEVVKGVHGGHWKIDRSDISRFYHFWHEHQRDAAAHDTSNSSEHSTHGGWHHVKIEYLRKQYHEEELFYQTGLWFDTQVNGCDYDTDY